MAAIGLLLCNLLYGAAALQTLENKEEEAISVVLVQGNHSGLAMDEVSAEDMLKDYISLTKSAMTESTALVIWPETSVPIAMGYPVLSGETLSHVLEQFCKEANVGMILGSYDHIRQENNELIYNAMFYVTGTGVLKTPYYKQKLVPFGEYLPYKSLLSRLFPKIVEAVSAELNDEPGNQTVLMHTEYGTIGGIICYDSIFPQVVRDSVKQGAQMLALISNDSWFGKSAALHQHHTQAIMRAVENRRYICRASNTGITSIISDTGRVIEQAPTDVAVAMNSKVSIRDQITLYTKIGNFIVGPAVILWLILIVQKTRRILLKKQNCAMMIRNEGKERRG